ncbi:MAG: polysaccharide biosynthesis C-terminal domain-containing protein [Actinomycetota bacterium]|nr:polysaccharide biosynthesis C-terminal domain-containing protein [Actinomycetota bacterium]
MTQADPHLSRLATGGLLSIAGSGVSSLAGIVLVAVITNAFQQSLAGTLFAATAVWVILSALTQLGTEVGLVRWLPVLRATGRTSEIPSLLRTALAPVLVASTLLGGGLLLLAETVAPTLFGAAQADDGAAMLVCLAFFVPVNAVYTVLLAATRGLGTMSTTVAADLIGRSLGQPLAVIVVAWWVPADPRALVLAWLLPYLPACGWAAIVLRRQVRRTCRRDGLPPPSGRDEACASGDPTARGTALWRDFWGFTSPRALATLAQAALKRVDIVMVAALRSPAEAAVYTAATRFVVLGQLAVQAIQQALSPLLSGLFARDDRESAQRLFQTATAWMMALGWPVYLISAAVASLILSIFGDGYSEGASVVVILALAMLFATASGSVDTVLLMGGRSWLSLVNNLGALAVNVGLNLVLIPRYGIVGAAVSWAVAIVVRNLLPMVQVRLGFGLAPGGPAAIWVALSAVGCFGVPALALHAVNASGWLILGVATVLGTPAYLAALWWRRTALYLPLLGQTLRARGRGHRGPEAATRVRPEA